MRQSDRRVKGDTSHPVGQGILPADGSCVNKLSTLLQPTKALLHWSGGIWVTLPSTYMIYLRQKRTIVVHLWWDNHLPMGTFDKRHGEGLYLVEYWLDCTRQLTLCLDRLLSIAAGVLFRDVPDIRPFLESDIRQG